MDRHLPQPTPQTPGTGQEQPLGLRGPSRMNKHPRRHRTVTGSCDTTQVPSLCQKFRDPSNGLSERIGEPTRRPRQIARQNDVARRLTILRGIGPVTAVSIAVLAAPPEMFNKGRDLTAGIGLVARRHSTGGPTRPGKISKTGQHGFEALADHRRHVGDPGRAKARLAQTLACRNSTEVLLPWARRRLAPRGAHTRDIAGECPAGQ